MGANSYNDPTLGDYRITPIGAQRVSEKEYFDLSFDEQKILKYLSRTPTMDGNEIEDLIGGHTVALEGGFAKVISHLVNLGLIEPTPAVTWQEMQMAQQTSQMPNE